MYTYMYLSYSSPPVVIHAEITLPTKRTDITNESILRKNSLKCYVEMMIDHLSHAAKNNRGILIASLYDDQVIPCHTQ